MEKIQKNDQEAPLSEGLQALAEMADKPINNENADDARKEKLLKRAKLYKRFGKIALILNQIEGSKSSNQEPVSTPNEQEQSHETEESPEDKQADAFLDQLESALGDVDHSLENQLDYSIINHKQINTRDALERELQGGTCIPELDIRFDKDGKPWISHSQRAGARFFFSKPIHELHSEEVEKIGKRLSLEDALEMIQQYKQDNDKHRVVLELKELGPNAETRKQYLEKIKEMLGKTGLEDSAIFATLSPSILAATHDAFPSSPKILNGGIAPVISCNLAEKSLGPEEQKESAIKLPNVELFISDSSEIAERPDGYGKQTGYLWMRLPKQTVDTLRQMNETAGTSAAAGAGTGAEAGTGGVSGAGAGVEAGTGMETSFGAASLTIVNKVANVLDKISPKSAKALRERYAAQLDKLGIKIQVAISKHNPAESLMRTKEQMGQDSIIYANDKKPGEWAANLPKKQE